MQKRIKNVSDCEVLIDEVNKIIQKLKEQQMPDSERKKLKGELVNIRADFQHLKDMINTIIIAINKTLVKH